MIDANSQFFAILTNVGMAKQANADALGIPWKITDMGVGDANGTDPIPNAAQTALIHEWRRRPLNQLKIDPNNPAVIIAEQIIPADEGGKWIREIGLYDADGDLVAVANCAPSFKPVLSQGSGRTQIVRMNFIVTSAGNITLKIDPAIVLASRAYVDAAILEVLPKNKTPGEWTRVKTNNLGLVVSGDNPSTLAGMGITDSYTKAQIEAIVAQASALPVGAMVAFPKAVVPPGFLEIDGSVQSIATYPDLAAYLGTTFNTGGEGVGNFRLPESRGEFFRGWDHGRAVDAGRAVGSSQIDAFQGHFHSPLSPAYAFAGYLGGGSGAFTAGSSHTSSSTTGGPVTDGVNGAPRTSSETRPRNLAVMWCIKAWNAPVNQGNIDVAALAAEVQALRNLAGAVHKGLFVSATGTNALIAIKARRLLVGNGGSAQVLDNVDLSINLAAAGLGGLDNGVLAASSWYSTWVATNGAVRAGIAAAIPSVACSTVAGSPVVTGIASTAQMRPGMPFGGANFPPGAVIKSVDSAGQITASVPAITTGASTSLRFVYEPVLPVGYVAKRVNAFITDGTANKFPYGFNQFGQSVQLLIGAGKNLLLLPQMAVGAQGSVGNTLVAVAHGAFVPVTATRIRGIVFNGGGITSTQVAANSIATIPGSTAVNASVGSNGGASFTVGFEFALESPFVYYSGNAAGCEIRCLGWEDDL